MQPKVRFNSINISAKSQLASNEIAVFEKNLFHSRKHEIYFTSYLSEVFQMSYLDDYCFSWNKKKEKWAQEKVNSPQHPPKKKKNAEDEVVVVDAEEVDDVEVAHSAWKWRSWGGRIRSSHRRCSVRKDVLRNFAKFAEKHLCQSFFFNKVASLRQVCRPALPPQWFYVSQWLSHFVISKTFHFFFSNCIDINTFPKWPS